MSRIKDFCLGMAVLLAASVLFVMLSLAFVIAVALAFPVLSVVLTVDLLTSKRRRDERPLDSQ